MSAVFYYHPKNLIARKLKDLTQTKGFLYTNRAELELRLAREMSEAGFEIWPQFHTIIGSIAGGIHLHIPLNPDEELDRHTIKMCQSNQSPWCFLKVVNGPKMSQVVGYCSTGAHQPFGLTNTQLAQKGIISATYVPRAL